MTSDPEGVLKAMSKRDVPNAQHGQAQIEAIKTAMVQDVEP
jgi:hypothetical protein